MGTTINYRIHGDKDFSFLGGPVTVAAMPANQIMAAMTAAGALNLMAHPAYPGGMIRQPGPFRVSTSDTMHLRRGLAAGGMAQHHVHVGGGGIRGFFSAG